MTSTRRPAEVPGNGAFSGGAAYRNRTDDLRITSALLWPTELRRRAVLADGAWLVYRFPGVRYRVRGDPEAGQWAGEANRRGGPRSACRRPGGAACDGRG